VFDVVVGVVNGVTFTMVCVTYVQLINLDDGVLEIISGCGTNLNSIS